MSADDDVTCAEIDVRSLCNESDKRVDELAPISDGPWSFEHGAPVFHACRIAEKADMQAYAPLPYC